MKGIVSLIFIIFCVSIHSQENKYKNDYLDHLSKLVNHGDLEEVKFLVTKALDTAVNPKFIVDAKFKLVKVLKKQGRTDDYYKILRELNTITIQNKLWEEYFKCKQVEVDYLVDKERYNEATQILINLEKFVFEKHLKDPQNKLLNIKTNLLSVNFFSKDSIALHSAGKDLLKAIALTDSLDSSNYSILAESSINYADYLDNTYKDQSFKWYKRGNKYAHLGKNNYLVNFSRLRIAGSLNLKDGSLRAIDTLRMIQKDSSIDLNVRYLMYDGFTSTFKLLNQKDSVRIYEVLRDEIKEVLLNQSDAKNESYSIEDSPKDDFNFGVLISILTCIIGFSIFTYIFYKSRK